MAFDETLAARIRDALARTKGIEEKKMLVLAPDYGIEIRSPGH